MAIQGSDHLLPGRGLDGTALLPNNRRPRPPPLPLVGAGTQYHRTCKPSGHGETFTGARNYVLPLMCLSRVEPRSTTDHGLW